VAQILKISSAYTPAPPEGFVSPMTWGIESQVAERFTAAGVPADRISFVKDSFVFRYAGAPRDFLGIFRQYYGPTMNAFEAASKNGREGSLLAELEELFTRQNTSARGTTIPATFLRVEVAR
jgi:hypothetical protein